MMKNAAGIFSNRYLIVSLRLLTAIFFAFSTLSMPRSVSQAQDDLELALAEVQAATSIEGTLDNLVATFNLVIPEIVVSEGYRINSLITLSAPLPSGSKVTITRDGAAYVTEAEFIGTEQWITSLMGYPLDVSAIFDHTYDNQVERYVITVSGNTEPIDVDITIQSIIFSDLFATERVILADITLDLIQDIDGLAEALAEVQAATSITGTLDNLVADFNLTIPEVVVGAGFKINSLITLSEPLPTGSKVTITRDGGPYVIDALFTGTEQWITSLLGYGLEMSAFFDHMYDDHDETYAITVSGNPEPINVEITIQSIISRDLFDNERVVLAETTLTLIQDVLDEDMAVAYVQQNTTLTGTLADLTATFPLDIPDVLVNEPYKINSRMTLGQELPAGSTVSIQIRVNGSEPFPYVTDVPVPGAVFWVTDLFNPAAIAADFDEGYSSRVEIYAITINLADSLTEFDTTVKIESIISKDNFFTSIVLADITLPIHVDDTTPPELFVMGMTADSVAMSGNMETGYILGTTGQPRKDHLIQFTAGTSASEPLATDYFEFTLTSSSVAAADLEAYYRARGVPEPYLTYLIEAAYGNKPFVLIRGADVTLVDAAKHAIQGLDVAFTVPDDFPVGSYTATGTITDLYGNNTAVTLKLIVMRIPSFGVNPEDDSVYGWYWPAGATITMTTHESSFQQVAGADGVVEFNDSGIDISVGDEVILTDNETTKSHIVKALTYTGYNLELDTITGRAASGSMVHVWGCKLNQCASVDTLTNNEGIWTADFAGSFDIVPGMTAGAQTIDEDNDDTRINWVIPDASVRVYPDSDKNQVEGVGWIPGSVVSLYIDQDEFGSQVASTEGDVLFDALAIDLEAGMEVELTDGFTTMIHHVVPLAITGIDQSLDEVHGNAVYPGEVEAFVIIGEQTYTQTVPVAESGSWTAIFSEDIGPGVKGGARQYDDRGNSTRIYWEIDDPYMIVDPQLDTVKGFKWMKNSLVEIVILSSGLEMYTSSVISNENGAVVFDLDSVYDILPGMEVVLADAFSQKTHQVFNLQLINVDKHTDEINGTADPGSILTVTAIGQDQTGHGVNNVFANAYGDWWVDFTDIQDIVVGTYGYVEQKDEDFDFTRINYTVVNEIPLLVSLTPSFTVAGTEATTLIVNGQHFSEGYSVVRWNGEDRPTTYISDEQLSIELTADDLDSIGTGSVEVFTEEPAGGDRKSVV